MRAGPATSNKPGEPGERAGKAQAQHDQPRRRDAGEARRPRRLPGQLDVEAQDVLVQQDVGEDHRDEGRDDAPMHAGIGDQFGVRGRRILRDVARAGKARALGVAHPARRHRREDLLGDIDQQQRDQDLVGVEPRLQDRRDHRPGPAAEGARQHHQRKDVPARRREEGQRHRRPQSAPMMYCPSAPMFQMPARKPMASPTAIRISGPP
jgi:hypothetical protein